MRLGIIDVGAGAATVANGGLSARVGWRPATCSRTTSASISADSSSMGAMTLAGVPTHVTSSGHVTAPALHDTLTRLTAADSLPGLAAATRKFVVGSTTPSPQPYMAMVARAQGHRVTANAATPSAMSTNPADMVRRAPYRTTSTADSVEIVVDATNWIAKADPAAASAISHRLDRIGSRGPSSVVAMPARKNPACRSTMDK